MHDSRMQNKLLIYYLIIFKDTNLEATAIAFLPAPKPYHNKRTQLITNKWHKLNALALTKSKSDISYSRRN